MTSITKYKLNNNNKNNIYIVLQALLKYRSHNKIQPLRINIFVINIIFLYLLQIFLCTVKITFCYDLVVKIVFGVISF